MATKRTPAKRRTTSAKRRRTTATTPTRRRRTTRKKGLSEMLSSENMKSGIDTFIGVTAGYIGSKMLGKFINPEGDKNNLEIGVKIGAGLLIATYGKRPNIGAGVIADGLTKVHAINEGLGDLMPLNDKNRGVKYLNEAEVIPTGITAKMLNDYTAAYQSSNY